MYLLLCLNLFYSMLQYTAAPQPTSPPMYQQPGVAPPYQSGPTPGYYPTGPDTTGYQQPAGGFYPPPPETKGYPPQDNAYPPPYPPPQQGYPPPTTNPYPYGAPTAPQWSYLWAFFLFCVSFQTFLEQLSSLIKLVFFLRILSISNTV